MRALPLLFVLSFALPAAPQTHAEGERWLGYGWDEVASARYRVVSREESVTVHEGKSTPSTATVETDLLLLPGAPGEKETVLEVRFERVRIQADPPGLEADSDATASPKGGPLAALPGVLAAVRGTPLRIALSPGGRALRVEGMPAFLDAARAALPEGANRDGLLRYVVPISDAELAERISAIVMPLPNRAVAAGTALPVRLPIPGTAEPQEATVTFAGVETVDGREVLRVVRTLSAESLPPSTVTQGGRSVVVTTTRYATDTTLLLSPALGIPLSQVTTTTSAQTVAGSAGEGGAPVGSVVEMNRTVEATLVAHEPAAAKAPPAPPATSPPPSAPPS
jgi:hypothetical protein